MRKYLSIILIPLMLTVISGCQSAEPVLLKVSQGKQVQAEEASEVGFSQGSYTGTLVGVQEVDVFSKINGKVEKVLKDIGDEVKVGEALVLLETNELQAQLSAAKADVMIANASYEQAEQKYTDVKNGTREEEIKSLEAALSGAKTNYENLQKKLERSSILYEEGAVSKQSYEDLQTAVKAAEAQFIAAEDSLALAKKGATTETLNALKAGINQANAGIEKAKSYVQLYQYNLDNSKIQSPIKGYVAFKNISEGELANPSQPVMKIVNTDQMYLDIQVPEDELSFIQADEAVKIKINALNQTVEGKVDKVSPKATAGTSKFLVRILIENPEHTIRSGMTGIVMLEK